MERNFTAFTERISEWETINVAEWVECHDAELDVMEEDQESSEDEPGRPPLRSRIGAKVTSSALRACFLLL